MVKTPGDWLRLGCFPIKILRGVPPKAGKSITTDPVSRMRRARPIQGDVWLERNCRTYALKFGGRTWRVTVQLDAVQGMKHPVTEKSLRIGELVGDVMRWI